ncbi:MAG: hypothetical protein ACLT5C_10285 [Blautia hansenii]
MEKFVIVVFNENKCACSKDVCGAKAVETVKWLSQKKPAETKRFAGIG